MREIAQTNATEVVVLELSYIYTIYTLNNFLYLILSSSRTIFSLPYITVHHTMIIILHWMSLLLYMYMYG